ncbi:hypothetical protein CHS0354_017130 [Potamilus streckersoni]|uniref:Uncharacterized protein n=1 Tax=Potamilus streckersoni TaxID=2493646 RepID=A0AAE0S348_9BIVA|nr:hypothetical protein CHS0354_017130 [Potamilus streckersoni]
MTLKLRNGQGCETASLLIEFLNPPRLMVRLGPQGFAITAKVPQTTALSIKASLKHWEQNKVTIYNIYDTIHSNSSTVQDYTHITKDNITNSIICRDSNGHNVEWGSD